MLKRLDSFYSNVSCFSFFFLFQFLGNNVYISIEKKKKERNIFSLKKKLLTFEGENFDLISSERMKNLF